VRAEVERKEFLSIQNKWKIKKCRESEAGVKNYYNGGFSYNKTYFARQSQDQSHPPALKRANTSLGHRPNPRQLHNRFS
jgi:hypothetical protein